MTDLEQLARQAVEHPVIGPSSPESIRSQAVSIRRRRRRFGTGVAVIVILAGSGIAAVVTSGLGPTKSEKVVTTAPSSTPTRPVTTFAAPTAWPTSQIQLSGNTSKLVAGAGVIYAEVAPTDVLPIAPSLAAVNVNTGAARYESNLGGALSSIAYGNGLWVAVDRGCDARFTPPCDLTLQRRNPVSLALVRTVDLGTTTAPAAMATAPGAPVWVAAGSQLIAVNPSTFAVSRLSVAGASTWSLSIDPTGRYLYTATTIGHRGGVIVQKRNLATGQVLASNTSLPAVSGGVVSASNDGVWVSFATGMQTHVAKLSASTMTVVVPADGQLYGSDPQINPVNVWAAPGGGPEATISGGDLWITLARAVSGVTDLLACADPSTGAVHASDSNTRGASLQSSVVSYNSKVYVGGPDGITVSDPPSTCQLRQPSSP